MPTSRMLPLTLLALATTPLMGAQPSEDAGEKQAEQIERSKPQSLTLIARAGGSFQADADFDNDIGELSLSEYRAGLTALWNIEDAGRLTIDLSAALLDYDVTPSPTAVAGDSASIGAELDDIHQFGITAIYSDSLNDTTNWFLGGGIGFSGEDNADFGDSFDWLATGGFEYKQSDTLSIGVGVLIKSRLEDDVLIVPIPRINWTIDERWSLRTERAGLELRYKHSDQLSYGVFGEYRSDSFRLDDTHAAAVDGMGTHRRIPVGMFADFKASDRIRIEAAAGAALGGELEFLDANGNDVSKQDLDPGIFGAITVSFRF
ncbi:MAG: hypothetical protein KDA29_07995 [Phycisphaerales bacterium]|nr:hypothetical protein [Phycisphaerales bacterium]